MAVRVWHILIVVIIVGLAAFLLLPPLNTGHKVPKRTRCLSNLKQIGQALEQYAFDNEEAFAWADIEPDQSYRCFGKLHRMYMSSLRVLTCPSSGDKPFKFDKDRSDGELFSVEQCRESLSYAYGHNGDKPWTEETPSTTRIAADKYVLVDYTIEKFPRHTRPNHYDGILIGRHMAGRNVVCIDGSGKWDNSKGPLKAGPGWDVDGSDRARNDQTGPDWWSDPPEK